MEQLSGWFAANSWFEHLIIFVIGYTLLLIALRIVANIIRKQWIRYLQRRFPDPADIQRILNQIPWEGETLQQLRLSFGHRLSRTPPGQGTLRIYRCPKQEYIVALRDGRVSGWQLYKS